MGLIVEVIPQGGSLKVTSIPQGGSLKVTSIPQGGSLKVTSIPQGGVLVPATDVPDVVSQYVLTDNSSSDVYSDMNAFDMSIYRILSMRTDMETVAISGKVNNEFELFLQYAEVLTAGGTVSAEFVAFNNYLGSLGV